MNIFRQALEAMLIGRPVSHRGLTFWPLVARRAERPAYDCLAAQLRMGTCRISVIREAGCLPSWLIRNQTERPVFASAGASLWHEGRPRRLERSLIVGARGRVEVPASWLAAPRLSAEKRSHEPALGPRGRAVYVPRARQTGLLCALNGRLRAIDVFGDCASFARGYAATVHRFGLEASTDRRESRVPPDRVVADWLEGILACTLEAVPTLGEGQALRPAAGNLVGQVLTDGRRLVHARLCEAASLRPRADLQAVQSGFAIRSLLRPTPRTVRQFTLADPWAG